MEWGPKADDIAKPTAVAEGPPVTFVDVNGEQAWRQRFGAAINDDEVEVVKTLVETLVTEHGVEERNLGVITPFRGQRSRIADAISSFGNVEISTVDGFQGRERDIIIFSTVNTEKGGLKFGGNRNRFTVASTRPKDRFIMVGNKAAITANAPVNSLLRKYVEYASAHGGIFDWDTGSWSDGVDPSATQPRQERDEPDRKEPNDNNQSDELIGGGSSRSHTGDERGSNTGVPSRERPTATAGESLTAPVDTELSDQLEDLIRLAPTSNGELADAWELLDGREAWEHLSENLTEYFKRNENHKIVPTDEARALVESHDT